MVLDDDKWYTKRGARLQGPYSRQTIHRYLLLGRIKNSDRVSKDGAVWEPITQVPELIPEELLNLDTDFGWKSFLDAREQVDERQESTVKIPFAEQRSHPQEEDAALTRLRRDWLKALNPEPEKSFKSSFLPASLFGITLFVVVLLIVFNTFSG
ncbi:MAG: hypothetical protein KDJ38_17280 [Gammaproteobacteria bacterium]|nr:hypothetical protein [Gammaproteobacteria bacterium]